MDSLRIHFGNVNDDRNTPSSALPAYTLPQRLTKILDHQYPVDIFALSEISIGNLDMVKAALGDRGYTCETMAYAPGQEPDMSFYYVVAWRANIKVEEVIRYWFTSTPEQPLNPDTRKSDRVLQKYDESYEKGTLCIVVKWGRRTLGISLNHFGLIRAGAAIHYVYECSSMLAKLFNTLRQQHRGIEIVTGSDFNAFSTTGHVQSLCLYSSMWDITPPDMSFCSYPWDFGGISHPQHRDLIDRAKKTVGPLVGDEFVSASIKFLHQLYGGPLKDRLDSILVSDKSLFTVKVLWPMTNITLDNYSVEPFAPSDHSAYLVEVKP
jgi:hypothetical protein